ncbi:cell surface glycoprotein CD200 receptor 1-A, partial [Notolabrus celidotus]|uniref:cell surface glycoprotein CD200 receptor 1-A n=1 Tax=Notolabrus celidotus TaxID=1203425 RepID=UPI00148F5DD1
LHHCVVSCVIPSGFLWTYLDISWWTSLRPYQSTPEIPSNLSPIIYVVRNASFNLRSDVNLTCSDHNWNESIYIIWNMTLKRKENSNCTISFALTGESKNTCNDRKSLRNKSSSQSYLHIPNFSYNDVGVYNCQWSFRGGILDVQINVAVTVPPKVSMWLERKENRTVAVCKAESGNPAANISWSRAGNCKSNVSFDSQGLYTVESKLEVLDEVDAANLSCIIRHPCWKEEKMLQEPKKGKIPLLYILIVVIIVVLLAGLLFIAGKKLRMLRLCQHTDSAKAPPTEDVEEVEPYASYVQRVNSIYNSSADLFT